MIIPRSTIIRQIALGYLLLALFSLGAVGYSLRSLHAQNRGATQLVNVDIRFQNMVRQLRSTLFSLERLERQALILQQEDLLALLQERNRDLLEQGGALIPLADPPQIEAFAQDLEAYQKAHENLQSLLQQKSWKEAEHFSRAQLVPLRDSMLDILDQQLVASGTKIDQTLKDLTRESLRAYRIVLILLVAGLALAMVVAVSVGVTIRRSLLHFAAAIRAVGSGVFDADLQTHSSSEFNQLAQEFQEMGIKLRDLEQQQLDANPLTRLPGNLAIEREIENRILSGAPFAHGFADLDNFKAYSDRYGYQKGSAVIALTSDIIRAAVREHGTQGDWVGHIGGDDYIFLTTPERAEDIARDIIHRFDTAIPAYYTAEDQQAGGFTATDRYGVVRNFALLSISVAVVCSERFDNPTVQAFGKECAKMKEHLKRQPGSCFLVDRRRGE
jgi:diguanylate cyclase (GGDEF)-like protein